MKGHKAVLLILTLLCGGGARQPNTADSDYG